MERGLQARVLLVLVSMAWYQTRYEYSTKYIASVLTDRKGKSETTVVQPHDMYVLERLSKM